MLQRDLCELKQSNKSCLVSMDGLVLGSHAIIHRLCAGCLIAETDAAGVLKREVIYLGDIPAAVVK